jgi:hypothetical protein
MAESHIKPEEAIGFAVNALVEVCDTFQGVSLKPIGAPTELRTDGVEMGSCITLTQGDGSWILAIVGDKHSCKAMTKALFGMEPEEEPAKDEYADAMGEIANMTAGVLKRRIPSIEGQRLNQGLPLFLCGTDTLVYVGKSIKTLSQKIDGDGLDVQVVLFWHT